MSQEDIKLKQSVYISQVLLTSQYNRILSGIFLIMSGFQLKP